VKATGRLRRKSRRWRITTARFSSPTEAIDRAEPPRCMPHLSKRRFHASVVVALQPGQVVEI